MKMIVGKRFKRWFVSMCLADTEILVLSSFVLFVFLLCDFFTTVSEVLLFMCWSSWLLYNLVLVITYLAIPNIQCRDEVPQELFDDIKRKQNEEEWFVVDKLLLVCSTSVCKIQEIIKITKTDSGLFSAFGNYSSSLFRYTRFLFGKRFKTQLVVIQSKTGKKHFILLNTDEKSGNEEFQKVKS